MVRFIRMTPADANLAMHVWVADRANTETITEIRGNITNGIPELDLSKSPLNREVCLFVSVFNPNDFTVSFGGLIHTGMDGREWQIGGDTCPPHDYGTKEEFRGLRPLMCATYTEANPPPPPPPPPPSDGGPPPPPPPPEKADIWGVLYDASTEEKIDGTVTGSDGSEFSVKTAEGRYDSGEIEPGAYQLEALVEGYNKQRKDVYATAGESTQFDFRLVKTPPPEKGRIYGKITDASTGNPMENAKLTVDSDSYLTGSDGTYSTSELDPGTFTIKVEADGYYSDQREVSLYSGQSLEINFALSPLTVGTSPFCEKPPEGYGFWQPIANVIYYLFCPVIKALYRFGEAVTNAAKGVADFLTNPDVAVAKAIGGLWKAGSPSFAEDLAKTVATALPKATTDIFVSVGDNLVEVFLQAVMPLLKQARQETIDDLNNEALTVDQIIDNSFERIAKLKASLGWRGIIAEGLTLGQVDALYQIFDIAAGMCGFNQLHEALIAAKISARVVPVLQRQEDKRFKAKRFGLGDYQRMVTREKLDLEKFYEIMDEQGIPRDHSEKFWNAHFSPPTLDDIITFNLRHPDKALAFERISTISDLDPTFKDIFEERFFEDLALSQLRWMFETGAITEDKIEPAVIKLRYRPDDAKALSKYITGFQARMWRRRYIMTMARAYQLGKKTADEVKTAVTDAGYTGDVATWLIKDSDLRIELAKKAPKEAAAKRIPLATVTSLWAHDIWDEADVIEEIEELGYEEEDREDILELARQDMEVKRARLQAKAG